MTTNYLTDNNVTLLLNRARLARDIAERADNRVDHSFYYALVRALEELKERRAAPAVQAEPLSVTDAEHVASVLEMIGSFEPDDIDSDSVDLRFELNGVDTGSDVSITEYATRGAAIIRQLSGNTEHVSQPVLPEHSPCVDAPDHIWLQTAGEWPASGEFSELTWSCDNQHPDDTLYVRADLVGKSPGYLQGYKDGCEWSALMAEANHPQTGDWLFDDPIELAKAIRKGPDMLPSAPKQEAE